jgi:uncharacterized protein YfaS (alpha-2-macroglobulin family)
MKRLLAVLVLPVLVFPLVFGGGPNRRLDRWKGVKEAMDKGLPRTAIERLEPIITAALEDRAYPEAIKAIARKIALQGNIEGATSAESIRLMQAAIARAPAEMHPVMEAILANWYWDYFQQNNWRFLNRTRTARAPGLDFTTWDLPRILAEIDGRFSRALANDKFLKSIPIADYDALLVKGNVPDRYRPTLYDFLAHNALEFYRSGEQAGAAAQDAFELSADSPVLGTAEEFLAWKIATPDRASPTVKALRLHQELLRFHQHDKDPTAFLDADLARIWFGGNYAVGEGWERRYKEALERFVKSAGKHEIAAGALHLQACLLTSERRYVEARALALRGVRGWPDSIGGRLCHTLVQQIEAKSVVVETERVWNAPWPVLNVRYCNLTKLHFRAVAADWKEWLRHGEDLDDNHHKTLLARKPARAWSADLPATPDYKQRTAKVPVPQTLKPGFYYLLASPDKGFGKKDNEVTFTTFWVSTLALVPRLHNGTGTLEGLVLDASSGAPLAGAEVEVFWFSDFPRKLKLASGRSVRSNAEGLFRFEDARGLNAVLVARHRGQELASSSRLNVHARGEKNGPDHTVFFTDRALYRPGQTIHYRGVCIHADTAKDRYQVLPGRALTVVLVDDNGSEVARREQRTNDFGSFSGRFAAPTGRLTGRMHISVKNGPDGYGFFQVEEYKRPKFQVALDAPKVAPKLGGPVQLQGKAVAYTGAPIDRAQVRYRVVRQVLLPDWLWWVRPVEDQEIAHGITATGVDGAFQLSFVARPDRSVAETEEPIFRYTVLADVTDSTGETRSGQVVVKVGYTALRGSLSADDWQTKGQDVKLTVRTTTLDEEPQQAAGTVKVHRLREPKEAQRPMLAYSGPVWWGDDEEMKLKLDPSDPKGWPLGEVIAERAFKTDAGGKAVVSLPLDPGAYRALLETRDRFGKMATALLTLQVLDTAANRLALKVPHLLVAPRWTVEPGEEFTALWGSGYDQAQAFIEVEHRGKLLQRFWTRPGQTQVRIRQKVTEAMRGGFTLRVTVVRANRAHLESRAVEVPWSNKELKIRWERFTSKLEPGGKVTWTAVVTGPGAKKAVAEMVATLYDEALDAYYPHSWQDGFGVFRQDWARVSSYFENHRLRLSPFGGSWDIPYKPIDWKHRSFPEDIVSNAGGMGFYPPTLALDFGGGPVRIPTPYYGLPGGGLVGGPPLPGIRFGMGGMNMMGMPGMGGMAITGVPPLGALRGGFGGAPDIQEEIQGLLPARGPTVNLKGVSARKNLNETAFFFPHLLSDKNGEVRIQFTMPEALTRWKFLGFAHDKELRAGLLTGSAVTSRDLMVQPHPPRFVREGDLIEFTVKVTNRAETAQKGVVRLTLADAQSGRSVDAALGNTANEKPFDIPAKESRTFSWRLRVPDDMGFLTYKAVAATGKLSDGEEGHLPVLSRRVLVTESLPLLLRGPQTRRLDFTRLSKSGASATLRHKQVTVQVVSNPSWYAVMALPYLMEFPYECNEQTFNRLYANALARHIAASDPKVRTVFERWKGTPALDSPLEKNSELRSVLLEETPWVLQAQRESQARRNVGILFDEKRLDNETAHTFQRLAEAQLPDGSWPWFPGGRSDRYITLYITTGFGRLRHLGVSVEPDLALKALERLDGWVDEVYQDLRSRGRMEENNLTPTLALYLYGRSFFLKDRAIGKGHKAAVAYFLGQAKRYGLKMTQRQSQGQLALALFRFGEKEAARGIMRSLKERSVTHEELGRCWRDQERSWWWYRAPIETQALMIEAFDEVMNDQTAVEECKVWLLKQKQTRDWKTTRATADACYALLLRGKGNPLVSEALVEIALGGQAIQPEKVEAGTGFYEKRYLGSEVRPELGTIVAKKTDEGVSWASVHWQYLEDVERVTAHEGTPVKLSKQLFTRVFTKKGPVLRALAGPLKVGDELVVRLELRVDRDMEYVHLKDERGSGTEPVNVLSQYRFQDGLAYYESTRDTASHFFIDYLPRGTYVFEYATRVVHRGAYHTGTAQIQCMYAPEFNSHSASFRLRVD